MDFGESLISKLEEAAYGYRGNKSIIADKSFQFSVAVVKWIKSHPYDAVDSVLFKQLLRSSTSIGANVEEALGAQSDRDFVAKLQISYKEARESLYWLRVMASCDIGDREALETLTQSSREIRRMIAAILRTKKENMKRKS